MVNLENICHFIPYRKYEEPLNIIHYVLEMEPQVFDGFKCIAMNRMHLVTHGKGILHTPSASYELKKGDVFFLLPAMLYGLESKENFQYSYISFLGARGNYFMDKYHINSTTCVFHGFTGLLDLWLDGLNVSEEMSAIRSEGILLYSFSVLGERILANASKDAGTPPIVVQLRNYIDNHLDDPELSLRTISNALLYNPKYLSTAFKANMKIGISEYMTNLRIQQACTLMDQGFTSIKDIATLCGYRDPLYFSKVFRAKIGIAPKEYQKQVKA